MTFSCVKVSILSVKSIILLKSTLKSTVMKTFLIR